MIPQVFDYLAPSTLQEAISLLQEHGDEAKILSGGHSLIPMMKLRLATPSVVIDINRIPNLDYIREENGMVCIGALAREADLEQSDLIRQHFPILTDASKLIADPQVRNMGTVCGNLAHGDAANDHPAVMLALGARLVATGPGGTRTINITDFFKGFYTTDLNQDEILTEIQIPVPAQGTGSAYHKLERKVGDYATAGVAAVLTLDRSGKCTYAGIGLTNVSPVPLKVAEAEAILKDQVPSEELIDRAAQIAADSSRPSSDLRGSEEYKRAMVKVLCKRMLNKALERARS